MAKSNVDAKKLKDGFYLEVRNKGSQSGIRIWRETKQKAEEAEKDYSKTGEVTYLGEVKSGKWQH